MSHTKAPVDCPCTYPRQARNHWTSLESRWLIRRLSALELALTTENAAKLQAADPTLGDTIVLACPQQAGAAADGQAAGGQAAGGGDGVSRPSSHGQQQQEEFLKVRVVA